MVVSALSRLVSVLFSVLSAFSRMIYEPSAPLYGSDPGGIAPLLYGISPLDGSNILSISISVRASSIRP